MEEQNREIQNESNCKFQASRKVLFFQTFLYFYRDEN